ncbi:MAG: hypothetical protein AAF517_14700, partial [Planctomycetota bacterium]
AACFTADAKFLVTVGRDRSVRTWAATTGAPLRNLSQHSHSVVAVASRPQNGPGLSVVATASEDRSVRFWQPQIGRMMRFVRLPSVPLGLSWSHDGQRLAVSCRDGRVRWIDPVEVRILEERTALAGWAYSIATLPKSRDKTTAVIVGGHGGEVRRLEFPNPSGP